LKKLDYIDALRGIAIISVLIVHTHEYGHNILPGVITNIVNQGARGVQLFFLVSAFTLFISFKNRTTSERFPIRNFFVRRFFRIAPMYYLGIGYYLIQDGLGARYWLGDAPKITIANIAANLTFLHGFNPYHITSLVPGGWSIGVEMTFYFMMPLLFSRIKNINQAFAFFIISILLKLVLQVVLKKFPIISFDRLWLEYLFLYFPSQLPIFCLGILFYFIVVEKESVSAISGVSVLVFSGMVLAQLSVGKQIILSNHILFGIGFLCLAYSLSIYRFTLLVNPIVNYIGKISFSMYVVHFAVLHWLNQFHLTDYFGSELINFMVRFLVVVTLTIIISILLYYVIEVPFQSLGKKLIKRWEKKHEIRVMMAVENSPLPLSPIKE
jgi:peptidoglycan/LPS O-acetylase OafA/YrhL